MFCKIYLDTFSPAFGSRPICRMYIPSQLLLFPPRRCHVGWCISPAGGYCRLIHGICNTHFITYQRIFSSQELVLCKLQFSTHEMVTYTASLIDSWKCLFPTRPSHQQNLSFLSDNNLVYVWTILLLEQGDWLLDRQNAVGRVKIPILPWRPHQECICGAWWGIKTRIWNCDECLHYQPLLVFSKL